MADGYPDLVQVEANVGIQSGRPKRPADPPGVFTTQEGVDKSAAGFERHSIDGNDDPYLPYKQCAAMSKSTEPKRRCRQPAMDNGKCRYHGGKAARGPANAAFKHGKYSKYIPKKLVARAEEFLSRRDLLNMSDELALLDSRVAELLESMPGGGLDVMLPMFDLAKRILGRLESGAVEGITEEFAHFKSLLGEGIRYASTWNEVAKFIEQRRRVVDTETRRLQVAQENLSAAEAMLLVNTIQAIVMRYIPEDPVLRKQFASEIQSVLGPSSARIGPPVIREDAIEVG